VGAGIEIISCLFSANSEWLDDRRAGRFLFEPTDDGRRCDESQWPTVQNAMFDAMVRPEKAIGPYLGEDEGGGLKVVSASALEKLQYLCFSFATDIGRCYYQDWHVA
jgi:hypothetical protein